MAQALRGSIIQNEAAYNNAIRRNILANALKTFRATHADAEGLEALVAAGRVYDESGEFSSYKDSFLGSAARSLDVYGKLTVRQVEVCRKILADRTARRAEWAAKEAALNATRRWMGEVGEKVVAKLTLRKVIEIERPKFSYYDSGVTFLHILEDADHNVAIYKGVSSVFQLEEGQAVEVQFTVKECGVRNGVKQTVIQRPKLVKH